MEVWNALVLGLVQGLTEFIPISSSGHLVIVQYLLKIKEQSVTFDIFLHFGTLVALLLVYWQDVLKILVAFADGIMDIFKRRFIQGFKENFHKRLAFMIIISCIPTGIMGIFFEDFFEGLFQNVPGVSVFILITGALLWIVRQKDGSKEILEMSIIGALLIGIAQGCAIAPGISRSGATIVGGLLFCGLSRRFAVRYAFLLFLPTIFGVTLIKCKDIETMPEGILAVFIGTLSAMVSGYLVIKWFLKIIQKTTLSWFSYYCWIIGITVLCLYYLLRYNV